jgi:hypothetical protein
MIAGIGTLTSGKTLDFSVECSKIVLWLEKRGDKDESLHRARINL